MEGKNKCKNLLMLALLLALLAFGQAGCPQQGGGQAKTIGIDFSFQQGAPPSAIIEGGKFSVTLNAKNYGSLPISGTAYLEDSVLPDFGGVSTENVPFSIAAASEEQGKILPADETITFPTSGRYSYSNLPSDQDVTIKATLEYLYLTDTSLKPYSDSSVICIGKDSSRCSVPQTKNVNTKTPLSITKVVKDSMAEEDGGVGFSVDIYLKRAVDGTLALTFGSNKDAENKIFVDEVSFAGQFLECDDILNGILEIRSEKVLRCTGIISGVGDVPVEHPLIVKLRYVVKTSKDVTINVKKKR